MTISVAHWLQNDYVETCELKPCADEDRHPGRTSCTKPFHRLSQLQIPHSQAQEDCPSWTMQELPRVIQDRNGIRQGKKETKVRDENRIYEYCTEPGHNTSVMAGAVGQFPFRVFVNRNRLDLPFSARITRTKRPRWVANSRSLVLGVTCGQTGLTGTVHATRDA